MNVETVDKFRKKKARKVTESIVKMDTYFRKRKKEMN